jgi:Ca2+-binding EF-hand superfamily protein
MVESLYHQASEPLLEFQLIKELFEYIDVRKDDQIDFQEFTQIFRNCTPPSLLMGTKPAE